MEYGGGSGVGRWMDHLVGRRKATAGLGASECTDVVFQLCVECVYTNATSNIYTYTYSYFVHLVSYPNYVKIVLQFPMV